MSVQVRSEYISVSVALTLQCGTGEEGRTCVNNITYRVEAIHCLKQLCYHCLNESLIEAIFVKQMQQVCHAYLRWLHNKHQVLTDSWRGDGLNVLRSGVDVSNMVRSGMTIVTWHDSLLGMSIRAQFLCSLGVIDANLE
jgi:hypothetical protein